MKKFARLTTNPEGVNSVAVTMRVRVNNDVAERERERDVQMAKVHLEELSSRGRRTTSSKGRMRRNGSVFRHMCFVSVEFAARQTRTGSLSALYTKSAVVR